MNTPIFDFLEKYSSSEMLRCHMPGHKGKAPYKMENMNRLFSFDITEIKGADSLFEADGIIAESERNMSQLYGSCATIYSTAGSTLCIQTMLALMKQENRKIFALRNVHRAFLNVAALLDLEVEWIMPEYNGSILSGKIDTAVIDEHLKSCKTPSCLYVTSPDYTGQMADISTLSDVCHRYGAKLLVDNAHGAHLAFFKEKMHPINLGADLCCDSAHKMLPALTGAAMLHTSSDLYAEKLKQAMSLFASTSPSYLIMCSLDLCVKYLDEKIRDDIILNCNYLRQLRENLSELITLADGEPFHITIKAAENGYDGNELAERLRENGAECEYSDSSFVILLMSPMNIAEDYKKLEKIIRKALSQTERKNVMLDCFNIKLPEKIMSIHDAVFKMSEEIDIENAVGRICASVNVPCPPAIPIVASGEIISVDSVNICKRYGISRINVVK